MNYNLKCNICNKSIMDDDFLKNQAGIPKYLVDNKFYKIEETTIFCSPECSTKWYIENFYGKSSKDFSRCEKMLDCDK